MLRNIIGVLLGIAMLLLPSYTGAEISHAKVLEQVASVEAQYFDYYGQFGSKDDIEVGINNNIFKAFSNNVEVSPHDDYVVLTYGNDSVYVLSSEKHLMSPEDVKGISDSLGISNTTYEVHRGGKESTTAT